MIFGIELTPQLQGQIAAGIVGVICAMLTTAAVFLPRFSKQQLDLRDLNNKVALNKAESDKATQSSDLANEQLIRTLLSEKDKKYDDLNSNFLMLLKEFSDLRINLVEAKTAIGERDTKIAKLEEGSKASDKQLSENALRISQLEAQVKELTALSSQMKAREDSLLTERDNIKSERDTLLKDQSKLLQRVETLEAQVKELQGELLTNKSAAEAEKRNYELQIKGLVDQLNEARSSLAAVQKSDGKVDPIVTQSSTIVPTQTPPSV